jgi:4-hydroxybenzoate polyprenyltransferase
MGFSRLKLFFALSRTPHGLLDIATPALAALVWLGRFPGPWTIALGLITAFAGYTAVYALNDVIDFKTDREKIARGGFKDAESYLDAVMIRHPVAQGFLSLKQGIVWITAWALVAIVFAYILNPVCVLIFAAGCALEAVYCLMLKISHFRTVISGAVKTTGGIAAVYAVDPDPAWSFVILLFLWLFFWEIGGQNIPADWTDIEEDRSIQAKTIPVQLGARRSNRLILLTLVFAVGLSAPLMVWTQATFEWPFPAAAVVLGIYLLLLPAYRLYRTGDRRQAMILFNRASYYPLTLLLLVIVGILM